MQMRESKRGVLALNEPDVFCALEQIRALRGRELVDLLTACKEKRVGKDVNVAEPGIRTLEFSAAGLGEHHLADDEIAEPTPFLQIPDLFLVGRAVVAVILGENECAMPSAHHAVDRVVVHVEHGDRAHGLAASRSWTISENSRFVRSDCSSVSWNSCQLNASSSTSSSIARTVAIRRVSARIPISPKNCPGPSVASSISSPSGLRRVIETSPCAMT